MKSFRLILPALAALVVAGCSRKEEPIPGDGHVFDGVKVAAVYASLIEKPDAAKALLIGDDAKSLKPFFTDAGVKCLDKIDGKADIVFVGCSRMSAKAREKLGGLVSDNGVVAWLIDVGAVRVGEFRKLLCGFEFPQVHLWMPGEKRWLLIARKTPRRVKLEAVMELFARERGFGNLAKFSADSPATMFANYVGTLADVMPAFDSGDRSVLVRPEFFISREPAEIGWLSAAGVDSDIAEAFFARVAEAQKVRRMAVEGAMKAAAGDEKGSVEIWAEAMEKMPGDVFLLERLERLERNAQGFLAVQKVLMAMKCYETMLLIRPDDPATMHNFGTCLKKIGKLDFAEKVFERSRELLRERDAASAR